MTIDENVIITIKPPDNPSIPSIKFTAFRIPTNQIKKIIIKIIVGKFKVIWKKEIEVIKPKNLLITIEATINWMGNFIFQLIEL